MIASGMELHLWFGQFVAGYSAGLFVAGYSAGLYVAVLLFYDGFVSGAELICYLIASQQLDELYSVESAKPIQY